MVAVVVDTEGSLVSKSFEMIEFCSMVNQNEKGLSLCSALWKEDVWGILKALWECTI